jgi:glycosyltransferase involved in cell wall biosynthesis
VINEALQEQPLVTVMVPVYNGEKTIMLTIKSLIAQTYKNWVCVIVNDGSTDSTKEILNKIPDSRFKIIHLEKNLGRGAARQVALENAHGKYLAYLDADDFYHPSKLEKQLKYLELNPDVSLVTCGQGSFNEKYELKTVRGKGQNWKVLFDQYKGMNGSYAGSMIRLTAGKRIKYNLKLNASEDRDYFKRYLYLQSLCVLDEVLYYYYELGKASSKKILSYQFETLKDDFYSLNHSYKSSSVIILKRISKILVYIFILPIFGPDFVIKKRGKRPLLNELVEFKKTLEIITKV